MSAPTCGICTTLGPGELVELDLILADPLRWPKTVWGRFSPPVGGLPASYRRFGAEAMGREWLMANGYDIPKATLRNHIRQDVPVIHVDVDELISKGIIGLSKERTVKTDAVGQPIDPLAYISFYNKGIELGIRGLELLAKRVEVLIDRGEEVPLPLIKQLVDAGMKLSTSQAAIKAAGKRFGDEEGDENEAFRGADESGPRFNGIRMHTIDGVTRPIADEGPADRAHYNDRAAQEVMPPLGGRRG